ncbi:MAG: GGDEF domain-containing protein [Hungatella sp.]
MNMDPSVLPTIVLFVLIVIYWYWIFELMDHLLKQPRLTKFLRLPVGIFNAFFVFLLSAWIGGTVIPYILVTILLFVEFRLFYKDTFIGNLFCTAACVIHVLAFRTITTGIFSMLSGFSIYELSKNPTLYAYSVVVTFLFLNIASGLILKFLPLDQVHIVNQHSDQQRFMVAWLITNIVYLLFNSAAAENPIIHMGMVANQIIAPLVTLIGTYIMLLFAIKTGKLLYQAERDSLTGLYNKGITDKLVAEHLLCNHSHTTSAFFMIDVDNFKDINDHFGHAYGDQVLCELGGKLLHIFRSDDIIGRIGGDEYIAYLKNGATNQIVCEKAEEICKAFHMVYQDVQGEKYEISSSVGVAVSPKDGITFEELYRHADTALYAAKTVGKDNYQIYDGRSFRGYQANRI